MPNPSEPSKRLEDLINKARNSIAVGRVYGKPIEKDGVTVIPAARVKGGVGGGGGGGQLDSEDINGGQGFGFGINAKPVGVYVIKGDKVSWRPAIDVTKIILTGCGVAVAYFFFSWLTIRRR